MKRYPKIKYSFAPASYWSQAEPLAAILQNVKGENRRQMIRDYWEAGKLEELDSSLLHDELEDDERESLGRIHPSFMGGEYLPGYHLGEVEVVRVRLQSTTSDVISVRARPAADLIRYRAVDEYGEEFVLPIPESSGPLTLEEMIEQLDDANTKGHDLSDGLSLGYNNMNAQEQCRKELRYFTRIQSPFYPQLEEYYEKVFSAWVRTG